MVEGFPDISASESRALIEHSSRLRPGVGGLVLLSIHCSTTRDQAGDFGWRESTVIIHYGVDSEVDNFHCCLVILEA